MFYIDPPERQCSLQHGASVAKVTDVAPPRADDFCDRRPSTTNKKKGAKDVESSKLGSTELDRGKSKRTRRRRVLQSLMVGPLVAIGLTTSPAPASADAGFGMFLQYKRDFVGSVRLGGAGLPNFCGPGYLQVAQIAAERTSAYPYHNQQLQRHTRIESYNGTSWVPSQWYSQSVDVAPGRSASWPAVNWNINQTGAHFVRDVFVWSVNGQTVGHLWVLYNQYGYQAHSLGGVGVAASGTNWSYCQWY